MNDDMRRVTAEMATALNQIAGLLGLSTEGGEPEVIVEAVRARLASTAEPQAQHLIEAPADDEGTEQITLDKLYEIVSAVDSQSPHDGRTVAGRAWHDAAWLVMKQANRALAALREGQ